MQSEDQVVGVCFQSSPPCYASFVSILAHQIQIKLNDSKITNNLKMIYEGGRTKVGCQKWYDWYILISVKRKARQATNTSRALVIFQSKIVQSVSVVPHICLLIG